MAAPLAGRTVVLGVTGSIAAFKVPHVVSRLTALGANVVVVMTANATR
ncbi:MAG: phosphopantothenoylcysteine decarboxylase, partial [Chloroflexi bacterium]|nr:phosphopantothenoylcysteine decarboxylase [Chloroflexota bacterium]